MKPLAHDLALLLTLEPGFDLLVPVPLHRSRLKERGFNQALVIAGELERTLLIPVADCLARTRRTNAQAQLAAHERSSNVADAFAVIDPDAVRGAAVLLIDDVVTTGATLGACADVLRQAGARAVSAATLAREL
ncbi:MAG: phosphoribosyltransferase family protein [Thermomicrobiales bacterium]